jgi:hypothetical protein
LDLQLEIQQKQAAQVMQNGLMAVQLTHYPDMSGSGKEIKWH